MLSRDTEIVETVTGPIACSRLQDSNVWRDRENWRLTIRRRRLGMITRYRVALPRHEIIPDRASVHTPDCGGAIFVTKRSCAAAISKVKIRISVRCSHYTRYIAFRGATKSYSLSCEHSLRRQNNNFVSASHCFVHFFFVVARPRREIA